MSRILLAEDSVTQGRVTRGLLKEGGHEVELALNGRLALESITGRVPDLLVTDLEMPEMDGLELVEAVHEDHPALPIVLLTAHGSEEIAVEALRKGAWSYVPKRNQCRDLLMVVGDLLSLAGAKRDQLQLLSHVTRHQTQFVLPNDPSLVSALVAHVEGELTRLRFLGPAELPRVGVALQEALTNAIFHGNLEVSSALREGEDASFLETGLQRAKLDPYQKRHVTFEFSVDSKASFIIEDQGPGFDPDDLPDPADPLNLEKASGRGILLIRTFMDDVTFNDKGNRITMVKNGREVADEGAHR